MKTTSYLTSGEPNKTLKCQRLSSRCRNELRTNYTIGDHGVPYLL